MRELVLELAVQGGIVQNSPDEAAVPYESIEDATPINAIEFPANWRVVLLADAIKNRSGNSKLIKGKLHEEPGPGRFLGFSASGADVWCDDYEHEGQAIIVSAVGARCGKAFKASGKWSAIANTNISRPEPTLFDFDFAYLVLNNEHFWVRGGSAQPFVKFPPSLDRHFALPPLAEQKRIVAKVDELMAWCDRLEAQQQEREQQGRALARAALARFADAPTPANLEVLFHPSFSIPPSDLRKSILTLAVQGKLVPQDLNDEPASKAIERLVAQNGTGRTVKLFAEEQSVELPFAVPASWKWVRFGNLVRIRTGKLDANAAVEGGEYPFFTCSKTPSRIATYSFDTSAVILAGNGDFNLKSYSGKFDAYQRTYVIEPLGWELGFCFWLVSAQIKRITDNQRGSAIPYLRLGDIADPLVPFPPLAEQKRIVAKVDELMALVDALETQLATARTTAETLLTAAVGELTNGKGTP
jgi:type I restriction enzyme S subunit